MPTNPNPDVLAMRNAGFSETVGRRDDIALGFLCAFNGVDQKSAPPGWWHYPNNSSRDAWARVADYATTLRDEAVAQRDAEIARLKDALEPFARADRAIGDEEGPFRFETLRGHRLVDREDFRRARAALTHAEGADRG